MPLPSQGQALCFCGFFLGNVEKGENLILTLIGLLSGLNSRKISNYPFDNYSLHIAPQAEKSTSGRKTATNQRHTHASHYLLGDRLACDGPHWLRKAHGSSPAGPG